MSMTNAELTRAALSYLRRGLSPFPCIVRWNEKEQKYTKHLGHIKWQQYQTRRPTESEIEALFAQRSDWNGIASATGLLTGLVVIDVDKGHNEEELRGLGLPPTRIAKTINGGFHYFYRHPGEKHFVKTISKLRTGIDVRGDGGLIILPPSGVGDHGYEWVIDEPMSDLPAHLLPALSLLSGEQRKKTDWSDYVWGVDDGNRNHSAAKIAGKLVRHLPAQDWSSFAYPLLLAWNAQSKPPLDTYELRMVFESIANTELKRRQDHYAHRGNIEANENREDGERNATTQVKSVGSEEEVFA